MIRKRVKSRIERKVKTKKNKKETIQHLLKQIEDLQLENDTLKEENETLKQQNKFHKHTEKKFETEKLKLQTEKLRLENLRNEIKLKSQQLVQDITAIQQIFKTGNNRLQNLNLDFLSIDHTNTMIEPIND